MRNCKIVTSGVDSEYVLGGLSSYLRTEGYEVIEIDFAKFHDDPEPLLLSLREQEIVYLTSAHTNLTLDLASYLVPNFPKLYPNYLSPIEIIPLLQPKLSLYIPHDLLTPYGDSNLLEIRFMDLFDHILAPTTQDQSSLTASLPSNTKVHHAGWIKCAKQNKQPIFSDRIEVVLFISMIEHLRGKYGVEGIVTYLSPLLKPGVKVKFPAWKGIEKIEQAIIKNSEAEIIPSTVNSIDVINQAAIIICNGASSIHAESILMGKPTICLLDDEGITSNNQLEKLRHLPNIHFHDFRNKNPIPNDLLAKLKKLKIQPTFKPFDYNMIRNIIEG